MRDLRTCILFGARKHDLFCFVTRHTGGAFDQSVGIFKFCLQLNLFFAKFLFVIVKEKSLFFNLLLLRHNILELIFEERIDILLFLLQLRKPFFILFLKPLLLLFITVFGLDLQIFGFDPGILQQLFRFMFDGVRFRLRLIQKQREFRVMRASCNQRGNACTDGDAAQCRCEFGYYHRFYLGL